MFLVSNKKHIKMIIKQLIVSFFILLLLFPSFQKYSHHHHHHIVFSGEPVSLNDHEDHCELCSFHFQNFIDNNELSRSESKSYRSVKLFFPENRISSFFSGYHFLLRGPPLSDFS
jgi:hypothetical protein